MWYVIPTLNIFLFTLNGLYYYEDNLPGRNKNNDHRFGVKIDQISDHPKQPLTFGSKNYYEPLKSYNSSQKEKVTDIYSPTPNIHTFDYDSNYDYTETNENVSDYVPVTIAGSNKENDKEKVIKFDDVINDSTDENVLPSYGNREILPEKNEVDDPENFEFPLDNINYDYDALDTYGNKTTNDLTNNGITRQELTADKLSSYRDESKDNSNKLDKLLDDNKLSKYGRQIKRLNIESDSKSQRLVKDTNSNDQGVY